MNEAQLNKGDLVRAWLCDKSGDLVQDLDIKQFTLESGEFEKSSVNTCTYIVQDKLVGGKKRMYKDWLAV